MFILTKNRCEKLEWVRERQGDRKLNLKAVRVL